jgi:hypothetical protein
MTIKTDVEDYGFVPFGQDEEDQESADTEDEFGFQPFDTDLGQDEVDADLEQDEEPQESFGQRIASNPVTQALLGLAKGVTYPLDLIKMFTTGEGLSDLDELEETFQKEGIPFDRNDYINKVFQLGEHFPTQQLAEDKFKEHTGINLEPKDTFSKIVRHGSEIAATGPAGLLSQAPKQIAKQGAKRLAGGIAGAAGSEIAKEAGVPSAIADILGATFGGAGGGTRKPTELSGNAAKNRHLAEKHDLRKFAGLERETPHINAIASREKIEKASQELEKSSKEAIKKVISGKIPIAKQREMGINLEDAYTRAYDQAATEAMLLDATNKAAKKAGKEVNEIDIKPLLENIKKKINKIRSTAPSLSPGDKVAIKELKKQYRQLTTAPPKPEIKTHVPIYGVNGEILNPVVPQKPLSRQPKKATAEQFLDQYRNFNEETKGIYRKPEFTGNEEIIKNIYGELKSDLIDSIDNASPKLANDLRFANKIFHETSKLNEVEGIVNKAFENGYDPKKLNQTLGSKRNRQFLERDLGKGAVQEIQDIARYGQDAEEKVLKAIKQPKTLKDLAGELTPLKASLIFVKGTAGLPIVIGHTIPKEISNRIKGYLMLKPTTRKSYADFLKHATSPQSSAFKTASQHLTKAINDEFGSEEELLKLVNESEE